MNRTRAATAGLAVPALISLGISADTSFRFLGSYLQITDHWERAALCGVAEAAVIALTVYAWATRTKGPAYLAYCVVLVQAVPAFEVSTSTGPGLFRAAMGPVLLTVLLHYLLGLEVRMSGVRPDGLLAAALGEARERLTASLGIGRRGANSAAIARSRAADRAVTLADKVAATEAGSRRYRRRTEALAAAIDAARHGLDIEAAAEAEAAIVGRIVRRKSVANLAAIALRYDWAAQVPAQVPAPAVPAELSAEHRAELPAAPVPAPVPAEAVPGELPEQTPGTPGPVAPAATGTTAEPKRNNKGAEQDVTRPVLAVVRNSGRTRADHIRALVAHGVTETGTIRDSLAEAGIAVPSDRYIRRLVSEARNTEVPQTGTNGYI